MAHARICHAWRNKRLIALALASVATVTSPTTANDIVLDGFTPNILTDDVVLAPNTNNVTQITESMGQRPGSNGTVGPNLFHSFLRFNIPEDHTALFTQDTGTPAIDNVIARVSGGASSVLDGTLRSSIRGANFWLINPAGVVFGADASVDIGGQTRAAFNVGAADFVVLADGSTFTATADAPVLSVSNPIDFGFLDNGGGDLVLNGTTLGQFNNTATGDRFENLRLAGRTVELAGGSLDTVERTQATGDIEVHATEALRIAGAVRTQTTNRGGRQGDGGNILLSGGDVELAANTRINSRTRNGNGNNGHNAGRIEISGRTIDIRGGAQILGAGFQRGNRAEITISAEQRITGNYDAATEQFVSQTGRNPTPIQIGERSTVNNGSAGKASLITLEAPEIRLERALIAAPSGGNATNRNGSVTINAEQALELRNSAIRTNVTGSARADGGNVSLTAGDGALSLTDTIVNASTNRNSRGRGGAIDVTGGQIELTDVTLDSSTDGQANAGAITIGDKGSQQSPGTREITITNSGIVSSARENAVGRAGDITILGTDIDIDLSGSLQRNRDERGIYATSRSAQATAGAGEILIEAGNDLQITGNGYQRSVRNRTVLTGTRIDTSRPVNSLLIPGSPIIERNHFDHGDISSSYVPSGNSTPLEFEGEVFEILGRVNNARGSAGSITLRSGGDTSIQGAEIYATTTNLGVGSDLRIAARNLTIDRSSLFVRSGVMGPDTPAANRAAETAIDISATGALRVGNFSSDSLAAVFDTPSSLLDFEIAKANSITQIRAEAGGAADAGAVQFSGDTVELSQNLLQNIALSGTRGGAGGNIEVRGRTVDLSNNTAFEVQAGRADGGSILIHADERLSANLGLDVGARSNAPDSFFRRRIGLNAQSNRSQSDSGRGGDILLTSDGSIDMKSVRAAVTTLSPVRTDPQRINVIGAGDVLLQEVTLQATSFGSSDGGTISVGGQMLDLAATRFTTELGFPPQAESSEILTAAGGDIRVRGEQGIVVRTLEGGAGPVFSARSNRPNSFAPGTVTFSSDGDIDIANALLNVRSNSNVRQALEDGTLRRGLLSVVSSAGNVRLHDAAVVATAEPSVGSDDALVPGGDIFISGSNVDVTGRYQVPEGTAGVAELEPFLGTGVSASSTVTGAAGAIDISGLNAINLTAGALIEASSSGAGGSGDVRIDAPNVLVDDARVLTSSLAAGESNPDLGAAGRIDINASSSLRFNNAQLSSQTNSGNANVARGSIAITSGAPLTFTGTTVSTTTAGRAGAGNISVLAPTLTLADGTRVTAESAKDAEGEGGRITLDVTDALSLTGSDTRISSSTQGTASARAGEIDINTSSFELADGAGIFGNSEGAADGGRISINADEARLLSNATVETTASGSGAAGRIELTTRGGLVLDGGSLRSQTSSDNAEAERGSLNVTAGAPVLLTNATLSTTTSGRANAGNISVSAPSLTLSNGTQIRAESAAGAAGEGGQITLDIADALSLIGSGTQISSSTRGTASARAGEIDINTSSFELADGAGILGNSEGAADGGQISINADEARLLSNAAVETTASGSGAAGRIELTTRGGLVLDGGGLRSQTSGDNADAERGSLNVTAGGAVVLANATLSTTTSGRANAGDITVNAPALSLTDGSKITAESAAGAQGKGGQITLNVAGLLELSGAGTELSSSTKGTEEALAGAIQIKAGTLDVVGGARILGNSEGAATGGKISIKTDRLRLLEGGRVETTADGSGNAGNIDINVTNDVIVQSLVRREFSAGSALLSASRASEGGDIDATIGGTLTVDGSRIVASVSSLTGKGGDVNIEANALEVTGSQIFARADAGNGGAIRISAADGMPQGNFLVDARSSIRADSNTGEAGSVDIESPDTAVNAIVPSQNTRITEVPEFDNRACGAPSAGRPSTFVVQGSEGYRTQPSGYGGALSGTQEPTSASSETRPERLRAFAEVSNCRRQALPETSAGGR